MTFTSESGAKLVLTPMALSSWPVIAAAVRASAADRLAPSAIDPGNCVAGGPMRVTTPCSWSVATWSGIRTFERWLRAAFCRPLDRPAIWGGFWTLSVQAK